jgi:HEAT repeat protein
MNKIKNIITVLVLCFIVSGISFAEQFDDKAQKIDALMEIISKYEFGMDRTALTEFAGIVTDELNNDEDLDMLEKKMLDFVQSDATFDGKQFICTQLSLAGSEKSVKPLLNLLKDPETSDMARFAIDRIPGKAADDALIDAVKNNSDDNIKIGAVSSLGNRRAASGVDVIAEQLKSDNKKLAAAAASALGMIGNEEAAMIIYSNLQNSDEEVRILLADSYLKCADNILAMNNRSVAEKIYRQILESEKDISIKQAALDGVLKTTANPVEPIVNTLKGDDKYLIEIAAANIRRLDKDEEIVAVAELLWTVDSDVKIKILGAFEDMKNPVTHKYVVDAVNSEDDMVCSAALKVLKNIGTKDDVKLFAEIAVNRLGMSRETARTNLDQFNADGTDEVIIELMNTGDRTMKVEMLRAVAERKLIFAYDEVLAAAKGDDRKLKSEAYKTLGTVAQPGNMDDLLTLLDNAQSDGERKRIEAAIVSVIGKFDSKDDGAQQVIEHLSKTESIEVSYSILRILSSTGAPEAYKILNAALNGEDETAQKIVIESYSNWPGDEPINDLMNLAKTSSNDTYRILALRSYLTLVGRSESLSDDKKLEIYNVSLELADAVNEKRLIISGIGQIRSLGALELATKLIGDQDIKREATFAALEISEEIAMDYPDEVEKSLKVLLEKTDHEGAVEFAHEILGAIKQLKNN